MGGDPSWLAAALRWVEVLWWASHQMVSAGWLVNQKSSLKFKFKFCLWILDTTEIMALPPWACEVGVFFLEKWFFFVFSERILEEENFRWKVQTFAKPGETCNSWKMLRVKSKEGQNGKIEKNWASILHTELKSPIVKNYTVCNESVSQKRFGSTDSKDR